MRKRTTYHTDAEFRRSIESYLVWLGVVSAIAAIHFGPVAFVLWAATAFILTKASLGRSR